jgi:putative DNA methylase
MKNDYKRLIEVDLPIKRISDHARAEKNMRSGHPWQLHIWWARKPWGACRSVALASLIPAPTDEHCPEDFVRTAASTLAEIGFKPADGSRQKVEEALLRFTGEFARWEAGSDPYWRAAARKLIQAAHPHVPHVFDPFSGYGAIPGEAARLGCASVASDLNPVAVLCLRTLLEAVPRQGHKLIEKFNEGARFIKAEAEKRLAAYYPKRNGRHVIAWLWARTVTCEGPGCGATVPLISQTTIARGSRKAWIEVTGDPRTKEVRIAVHAGKSIPAGLKKTAGGGHAICPVCGFTTNKERVKAQGNEGRMDHRLYGVAMALGTRQGKAYAEPTPEDLAAFDRAVAAWQEVVRRNPGVDPTEKYPFHDPRAFTAGRYGIKTWGDLFSPRQKLALHTIGEILRDYERHLTAGGEDRGLVRDTVTALALAVSNMAHYSTTMSTWQAEGMVSCFIAGNAIAMRWDWAEANPLVPNYVGGLDFSFKRAADALASTIALDNTITTVMRADAAHYPLPDDAAEMFFSDPPYYDVVPYADLSDLCYVWLKRFVGHAQPDLLAEDLTPKAEEIVVNPYAVADGRGEQSPERYQERMTQAFWEARRVLKPEGIGCIVFAHKGTAAWETLLASIIDAGFVVTASWPIDTERAARMRANKSAALGSSVHIVVRPRENPDGSLRADEVGDWRDVLAELPRRIRSWMQRLISEGVVGADAIFACLGPALEIYSRYARVEKANGDQVFLREYLEHVWATISREALATIFEGADATGFEPDARLTAMWLWTMRTEAGYAAVEADVEGDEPENKTGKAKGYGLEFDAVNNIAKGLGIHLEALDSVVEISKGNARLLAVSERTRYLFGKTAEEPVKRGPKKVEQQDLFAELLDEADAETAWREKAIFKPGATTLDRVHQAMILFATGRGEALKRLLVDDGAGRDARFWMLANALLALYPKSSEESRWVDGVLARKKGLGL